MNGSSPRVMVELEIAQRHLDEALKRLEAAWARRQPMAEHERAEAGAEREVLARDVAVLRSECDRLSAALRDAEAENRTIRETADAVVRRLDGSIHDIDRLLES
jgi:chromosome segregation ATPase